jgi:hypothetical protein
LVFDVYRHEYGNQAKNKSVVKARMTGVETSGEQGNEEAERKV